MWQFSTHKSFQTKFSVHSVIPAVSRHKNKTKKKTLWGQKRKEKHKNNERSIAGHEESKKEKGTIYRKKGYRETEYKETKRTQQTKNKRQNKENAIPWEDVNSNVQTVPEKPAYNVLRNGMNKIDWVS